MKSTTLENKVCAYTDCMTSASIRMQFPLGFSALFCPKCATKLQKENIAITTGEHKPESTNSTKRIDGYSTPASIDSSPNKKIIENG